MNRRRILKSLGLSIGIWLVAGGLLWLVRMHPDETSAGPVLFLVFLGNLVFFLGVLVPCLFQGLFFHTPFRTFLPLVKDTPVLSFFLGTEPPA